MINVFVVIRDFSWIKIKNIFGINGWQNSGKQLGRMIKKYMYIRETKYIIHFRGQLN